MYGLGLNGGRFAEAGAIDDPNVVKIGLGLGKWQESCNHPLADLTGSCVRNMYCPGVARFCLDTFEK